MNTDEIITMRYSNTAWLDFLKLPSEFVFNFEDILNAHPEDHGNIIMFGEKIPVPRFQKVYGDKGYFFTGMTHPPSPIPDIFKPFLEFVNELGYGKYNDLLINWYMDGSHYIGAHSDDERQLVQNSPLINS